MGCAQGSRSALYVEPGSAPHTFDSSSERYEFLYETLQKHPRIVGGNGIRGTRDQSVERTRFGSYPVGGRIAMNVSPADLDLWLPRILGAAENNDVFDIAESLPSFGVLVDRVTGTFEYTDCVVSRALFRGEAGPGDGDPDLLQMVLEIVAKDEVTGTSAPAVSLSTAANTATYVHSDAVFTFAAAAREVKRWSLLIDNHIQPRWVNSLTATALCPHDRSVVLNAVLPYDSGTSNLYGQALAGAAGSIQLTNGNLKTTFTFGTLQAPIKSPFVRGKTEIDMEAVFIARRSGSTPSISVNNDSNASS